MKRILAGLSFAFICSIGVLAQEGTAPPDQKSGDLVVRVRANYSLPRGPQGAEPVSWEAENVKYTTQGSAAPFKLVGPNIVVFVGVTPFLRKDGQGVILIAEGQVGLMRSNGVFSYQATVSKIEVGFGEQVLFLPLGLESPLKVYISVFRASELPSSDEGGEAKPLIKSDK